MATEARTDAVIVVGDRPAPPAARPPFAPSFSRTISAVGATLLFASFVLPAFQGPPLRKLVGERLESIVEARGSESQRTWERAFLPPETYHVYQRQEASPPPEFLSGVETGDGGRATGDGGRGEGESGGLAMDREAARGERYDRVPGTGATTGQLLGGLAIALACWNDRAPGDGSNHFILAAAGFALLLVHAFAALLVGLSGRGRPMGSVAAGSLFGLSLALLSAAVASGVYVCAQADEYRTLLDSRGVSFLVGGLLLILMGGAAAFRRESGWRIFSVILVILALAGGASWAILAEKVVV
ncbi:MAG: hypothetical protein HY720_22200 [Planctomycetes bacterium]|nr:hypothetical protein [Planctomycetota bacterium]